MFRKVLLAGVALATVLTVAALPAQGKADKLNSGYPVGKPGPSGQDNGQKLKDALAWLHKIEPEMSADMKEMVPALQAVLERYYNEPDSLRQSEKDLAEAFIATMPSTGDDLSGRDSSERMKDFESLLGTTPKKTTPPKTHTPPHTTPPVTHSRPKLKLPGISSKPVFTAVEKTAPGGKHIGAVIVSIEGRKKTVIEIVASAPKLTMKQRAQIVATRMTKLSAKNPLWWTTVKPGNANGEAVVRAAGAPGGFLVTADKPFASECGLTPDKLARQLAVKIRTTFDPNSGDEFGGRDLTPEQMRQTAIDLRQEGDDVYSSSAGQAEAKYKLAIQNDATYHVPYLRLADLYKSQHKIDQAKEVLQQGLKVDGIQGDQRSELEAQLKKLG